MQPNKFKFVPMFKQKKIRQFFERNGFAVSTRLAEVLGMKVKSGICFLFMPHLLL